MTIGQVGRKDCPVCMFCEQNATFAAAQSTDRGEHTHWLFVCVDHATHWNEGGDWDAPIYELIPSPFMGGYDGPT